MASIIDVDELPDALRSAAELGVLQIMVDGANARASRVAPCLTSDDPAPTDDQLAEARLVLVGAVKRWVDAGAGALSQQTAGPFSVGIDTRQRSGWNLWPTEITQLQDICASGDEDALSGAFSISIGGGSSSHMPWCALAFGAEYCSCGADLTNYTYPLYEGGVLSTGDDY